MNDRKKAAAITYNKENQKAPHLSAKGEGVIAEKIIQKAKEHNITVKEDKDLVEALSKLDIYQEIPEDMYRIMAELLSEIYLINKKIS